MKYALPAIALAIVLCFAAMFVTNLYAAERMITGKISKVVIAKDKNGAEYVRVLIPENKKLNGVAYQVTTAVFFFGDLVPTAKTLKEGDSKKFVVSETNRDGRTFVHGLAVQ
jgi:hypothetical protein